MRAARLLFAPLLFLAACPAADPTEQLDEEACPPESELTYENFGGPFLDANCQPCHSSAAQDRNGAPVSFTFDSVEDVRDHRERIFARAAGDNTSMPPGPDDPPAGERAMLAEWLACGAP
jgi:uncharacterized membrane protein